MPDELPTELILPWVASRTPQEQGLRSERKVAKRYGARAHPRSGAGHIKHDASSPTTLIEAKRVDKTHTLKGHELETLFIRSVQLGKEALYVVTFVDSNIVAEISLRRGDND